MRTRKIMTSVTAMLVGAVLMTNLSAAAMEQTSETNVLLGDTAVTLADTDFSSVVPVLSNAESGFLFGDQLDANNKLSYDAFTEYLANPSDTSMIIELAEEIVLYRSSRNISNWSETEYEEYANAVMQAVMPGVIACTLDYPELFWINFAEVACSIPDSGFGYEWLSNSDYKYAIHLTQIQIVPMHDANFTDFDEVLEIREHILSAVDSYVIEGDTDYEKCQSIYKSIGDSVTYNTTAPYAHTIAGVLYDTNAVCEGYAKTFKILCDRENIPCLTILGNFDEVNLTAHMWNYVYLDGAWYAADLTWDDALSETTYFMRGSAMFNQNHTAESPYSIMEMSFPELSVEDYIPSGQTDTTTTTTTTTTTAAETTTTTAVTTTMTTSETTSTTISSETTTVETESVTIPTETTTKTTAETTTETTTSVSEVPLPLYGDVNTDGEISMLDIVLLRKFLVGAANRESLSLPNADVNQDEMVNIFDAAYLIRYIK